MYRAIVLALIFLLIPIMILAQTGGRYNVAVLDLQMAGGVPESNRVTFSDRLRLELDHTGRFSVIERNTMEDILGEQSFQLSDCSTDECAVEVGRLLGVERMIAGSIGQVGQTYSIILRMIDVGSGRVLIQRNVDCKCPIDEVLSSSIRQAARMIAGLDAGAVTLPRAEVTGHGDLFIKSDPVGASIYIDDEMQEGVTPKFIESIQAGLHTIRLVRQNLVGSSSVFITPDEMARLELKLERGKALLKVISSPLEATVFLDGKEVGPTPQTIRDIDTGRHTLRVTMEGYLPYERTIELNSGAEERVNIELARFASLSVLSDPFEATVFLDGRDIGPTPQTIRDIDAGRHTLRVTMEGYLPYERTIELNSGAEERVNVELVRFASLSIASTPPGASVELHRLSRGETGDLVASGLTPLEVDSLKPGDFRVIVKRDGYRDWTTVENVSSGAQRSVTATLVERLSTGALTRAMLFPGLGHYYLNRNAEGTFFLVGELGAIGFLARAVSDYNGKVNTYLDARETYGLSVSQEDLDAAYEARMTAYDEAKSARNMVYVAVGVSAFIYLWNLVDVSKAEYGESSTTSTGPRAMPARGARDRATPTGFMLTPDLLMDSARDPAMGVTLAIRFNMNGWE